jgi:hypothetical protein
MFSSISNHKIYFCVISNEGRNRDRVGPFFSLFHSSVWSKFARLNFIPVFLDVLFRLPHSLNWLPLFQTLFWFLIWFELNNEYDTGCSAMDANPRLLISLVLLLLFETGVLFVEIRPSVVWELPNSWLLLSFRHLIRPCVFLSTMANRILDFMTNAIALLNWQGCQWLSRFYGSGLYFTVMHFPLSSYSQQVEIRRSI